MREEKRGAVAVVDPRMRGDENGRGHAASSLSLGLDGLKRALLLAGPTASGKSASALTLAREFGATIVNANSMQVYADLRILTARPTRAEEGQAPHRLFGEIDGAVNFSVGRWARRVNEILAETSEGPIIFVGGTGLYFRGLTKGLSDMPAFRRPSGPESAPRRKAARHPTCTPSLRRQIPKRARD